MENFDKITNELSMLKKDINKTKLSMKLSLDLLDKPYTNKIFKETKAMLRYLEDYASPYFIKYMDTINDSSSSLNPQNLNLKANDIKEICNCDSFIQISKDFHSFEEYITKTIRKSVINYVKKTNAKS